MAGYTVTGRGDLDALFMARVNTKRADVGYTIAGVDISNRYEPIASGTPIAATGFKSGGTDLANLFRGISDPLVVVSIPSTSTNSQSAASGFAQATFELSADGRIRITTGSNSTVSNDPWITPQTGMTGYSAYASHVSGVAVASGTLGSWIALGSGAVNWTQVRTASVGTNSTVIQVQIRRNSDSVVLTTANVTMTATRTT